MALRGIGIPTFLLNYNGTKDVYDWFIESPHIITEGSAEYSSSTNNVTDYFALLSSDNDEVIPISLDSINKSIQ